MMSKVDHYYAFDMIDPPSDMPFNALLTTAKLIGLGLLIGLAISMTMVFLTLRRRLEEGTDPLQPFPSLARWKDAYKGNNRVYRSQ